MWFERCRPPTAAPIGQTQAVRRGLDHERHERHTKNAKCLRDAERNANLSDEEVLAIIEQAREEVASAVE